MVPNYNNTSIKLHLIPAKQLGVSESLSDTLKKLISFNESTYTAILGEFYFGFLGERSIL